MILDVPKVFLLYVLTPELENNYGKAGREKR